MAFEYEVHGASKCLTYRLQAGESLDQDAYGMLKNNDLAHVLSPSYVQLDESRTLRYDVTGLFAARDYFDRHAFTREQFLGILSGMTEGFLEAFDYLLAEDSFACSLDCLYVDNRLNVQAVYVPVEGFSNGGIGARGFLQEVADHLEPDRRSGDADYAQVVRNALRSSSFLLEDFKQLLDVLTLKGRSSGAAPGRQASPCRDGAGPRRDVVGRPSEARLPERDFVLAGEQKAAGGLPAARESGAAALAAPSAVPQTGAPSFFDGMAVPPAVATVPSGDPSRLWPTVANRQGQEEKKTRSGLFGKRKEKRQEKGEAKEGRRLFKKKDAKDLAIPRGADLSGFDVPAAPAVRPAPPPAGAGVVPPSGASVSRPADMPAASYVDEGFGLTEVLGIPNVAEKEAGPPGDGPSSRPGKLRVTAPASLTRSSTGEVRIIDVTPFRIGRRRSEVDYYLAEKLKVSRVHAVITFDGMTFRISDNHSVNHTSVNGRRLDPSESVELADGDRIALGDEEFLFRLR